MQKLRFLEIDLLKILGLFLIILAHSGIPYPWSGVRNFDVVLMVLVSSALGFYSLSKKEFLLLEYLKKRVFRLVPPVWFFYIFFYIFARLYFYLADKNFYEVYDNFEIGILSLGSFGYSGYVWVIRVFLICALLVFLIWKAAERLSKLTKYSFFYIWIFNLLTFILWSLFYLNFELYSNWFLANIVYYLIGYSLVVTSGFWIYQNMKIFSFKNLYLIAFQGVFYLSSFIVSNYLLSGGLNLKSIQDAKYPPTFFYIFYGLGVSMILYSIIKFLVYFFNSDKIIKIIPKNIWITKIYEVKLEIISFLSSATLSIYLWHIWIIFVFQRIIPFFKDDFEILNYLSKWQINFVLISIFAVLISLIQRVFIQFLIQRNKENAFIPNSIMSFLKLVLYS